MRVFGTLLVAAFVSVVVVAVGAAVINRIDQSKEEIMATIDDIRAALSAQNTALAAALQRVAEDVQHLIDRGGATPGELDEVLTSIQGVTTTLEGVDPDPSFPAPPAG